MKKLILLAPIVGILLIMSGCSSMVPVTSDVGSGGTGTLNGVIADFDWHPEEPTTYQRVTFTGLDSYCKSAGAKTSCNLEYGWMVDGEDIYRDTSGPVWLVEGRISHSFETIGKHKVTLTVVDDQGRVGIKTQKIKIGNSPPVLCCMVSGNRRVRTFELDPLKDKDGRVEWVQLDFGDGSEPVERTENLREPIEHTYPAYSGDGCGDVYTATATARDDRGAESVCEREVRICYGANCEGNC